MTFCFNLICPTFSFAAEDKWSVARIWNEALLASIREDVPRPTVHARNLFHSSAMMYDLWAAFDKTADTFLLGKSIDGFTCLFDESDRVFLRNSATDTSIEVARAISHSMRRLLIHRFKEAPNANSVLHRVDQIFLEYGYSMEFASRDYKNGSSEQRADALGLYLADCFISFGLQDGSNEELDYKNLSYQPVNPAFNPHLPGVQGSIDPDRWQPIFLESYKNPQGGEAGGVPAFTGAEWGNVVPFAIPPKASRTTTQNGVNSAVHFDPGPPAWMRGNGSNPDDYIWNHLTPLIWSSHMDPRDQVMLDISPSALGSAAIRPRSNQNLHLYFDQLHGGTNSLGHKTNPTTGETYDSQFVPRGDYTRVIAEYWADGPDSETPSGHWFVILNELVADHPDFQRRYRGNGAEISNLEWDIKAYFMLGGAMHDAVVAAWSIKGLYDYVRPITAIRFMAENGQSTDKTRTNYHPEGLPLIDGLIEIVDPDDPLAKEDTVNIGKIKVLAWKGPDFVKDPEIDLAGVGWILGINWWPYQRPSFVTPPFAGYVSGHSTLSRAAAEVLTYLTGDPFFPGGLGSFTAKENEFLVFEQGPSMDVTLQWATFRDASDQTSLSRIWGGIHPPVDDIPGRWLGVKVADGAIRLADSYFTGNGRRIDRLKSR